MTLDAASNLRGETGSLALERMQKRIAAAATGGILSSPGKQNENPSLGEAMEIRVSDLPELSKKRLLAALRNPPNATFVVSESQQKWAWTGLIACGLGIWTVAAAADSYKWSSDDLLRFLILFVVALVRHVHAAVGYC